LDQILDMNLDMVIHCWSDSLNIPSHCCIWHDANTRVSIDVYQAILVKGRHTKHTLSI